MKRLKIILMIVLFFITTNVFAINDCTNDEMKRLRELANNVKITYEYTVDDEIIEEETVYVHYNIKVINLSDDLKIYYSGEDNNLRAYSKEEIEDMEFSAGITNKFYLYSYTNNLCTDELIKTISVKFPVVNSYYHFNKEKCLNNQDFKYCQEFSNEENYSFKEIDKMFDDYLNNGNSNNSNQINKYLTKYIYYIIGIIVLFLVIVIVIIKVKKNKKEDI